MPLDSILGAGLVSGIGSVLSGLLGSSGTEYSADMAYRINRETNEQNYRIWQEQQQHNIDMFNMQNEANIQNWRTQFDAQNAYNSPIEQMKRLRAAGLNPALAVGNQASTSAISSANAHPAQSPTMQMPSDVAYQSPLGGFANGMLQGLTSFANALNTVADAGGKVSKLPFEVEGLQLSNRLSGRQYSNLGLQFDIMSQDYEFQRQTFDIRKKIVGQQSQMLDAQITQMNLSNHAQQIMNNWLPAEKQLQMIAGVQNLELMKQQGLINEETCRNLQVQRVKMYAEIKNVEKDTEVKSAQKNLLIDQGEYVQEQTKSLKISNKEAEALVDDIIVAKRHELLSNMAQFGHPYSFTNKVWKATKYASSVVSNILDPLPFSATYNQSSSSNFSVGHHFNYK